MAPTSQKELALVKPPYMSSANDSERSGWGLWEQMRFMVMIVLWIAAWIARALLVFLPQQLSGCSSLVEVLETISHGSTLIEDENRGRRVWCGNASGLAKGAIGRALCQVLELVNDIPLASRKYEFARSLADKIIHDNAQYGGPGLVEVNKLALEAGFARTIFLLENSLEGWQRQQQVDARGWPWRAIKGSFSYPSFSMLLLPLIACMRNAISNVIPQQCTQLVMSSAVQRVEDGETAEKLAQELLWLAQKLHENSGFDVAILHWSSASSLANLSVYANPRVQRVLVKLSAYLCTGLANADIVAPMDVTLKLLLLWIPLLCKSTCNVDGAVFTSSEKHEAERTLERTILLLPDSEQEVVLGLWLREYVLSASDWPNLQSCYSGWCNATRKLHYVPSENERQLGAASPISYLEYEK